MIVVRGVKPTDYRDELISFYFYDTGADLLIESSINSSFFWDILELIVGVYGFDRIGLYDVVNDAYPLVILAGPGVY